MKLFGTDGIRDLAGGKKINSETASRFGEALVSFCQKRNQPLKIIVAGDVRESGPALEGAVVSGITSLGGNAVLAGVIPTPGLAYLVREQKAGAGIMISASHNSFEYNGLKPFKSSGEKMNDREEAEIERYILKSALARKKSNLSGKKTTLASVREKYVNFLLKKFFFRFKASSSKLVLDCANGATYEIAPAVFSKVAKEVDLIFANPNGRNINDNCGSQYPENLKKEVLEKEADLGLAFDGDGDRMIAVDEKGNALTGDQVIYIIAKMLKVMGELKNDLVVTTVMSNLGFVDALKKLGINHVATAVGDRQVFFEMKKTGAVLGGEESGHLIFSDFHTAGDGIVGGLLLLAAMDYFKKPLSKLAGEVALFPKLLVNVKVKRKPDLDTIPEIQDAIKEVKNKLGNEGRVFVRYSGTEDLCRVMVEGRDEGEIRKYADKIAKVIGDHLG